MMTKHLLKHRLTLASMAVLSGLVLANSSLISANETTATDTTMTNSATSELAVHVDTITEGSAVITGTAPFKGVVYAFVNGQIATEKAEIVDGTFKLVFLPTFAERLYQKTDRVTLSFMTEDNHYFLTHHEVLPAEDTDKEKDQTLYLPDLTSTQSHFTGTGPSDHQLLLYNANTLAFIQEAIIDQEGNYAFDLPNLIAGDTYLLLQRNPSSEYTNMVVQVVDKEGFQLVDKEKYPIVLNRLGLHDHSDWLGDENLSLGSGLTEETSSIYGHTSHKDNTAILITSSLSDKVYPLVPIDHLGYWGINLEELDWALELGESLTFSVVDTDTGEVYATLTEMVTDKHEGTPLEDFPFDIATLAVGDTLVQGKVAPNLRVYLYTNPDAENQEPELLGEVTSDEEGLFTITLTKPLTADDVLYFAAFDKQGTQVAWKALSLDTDEDDDNDDAQQNTDTGSAESTDQPVDNGKTTDTSANTTDNTTVGTTDNHVDKSAISQTTTISTGANENKQTSQTGISNNSSAIVTQTKPEPKPQSRSNQSTTELSKTTETRQETKNLPKTGDKTALLGLLVGLGALLSTPMAWFKKN